MTSWCGLEGVREEGYASRCSQQIRSCADAEGRVLGQHRGMVLNDVSDRSARRPSRSLVLVLGLIVGAAGIAILWAAGQSFPVYPPPGVIILVVGAVLVAAIRWRWMPLLAVGLGLFILVGFVVSSIGSGTGIDNLAGDHGVGRVIGQAVEIIGVLVAAVTGVRAVCRARQSA